MLTIVLFFISEYDREKFQKDFNDLILKGKTTLRSRSRVQATNNKDFNRDDQSYEPATIKQYWVIALICGVSVLSIVVLALILNKRSKNTRKHPYRSVSICKLIEIQFVFCYKF